MASFSASGIRMPNVRRLGQVLRGLWPVLRSIRGMGAACYHTGPCKRRSRGGSQGRTAARARRGPLRAPDSERLLVCPCVPVYAPCRRRLPLRQAGPGLESHAESDGPHGRIRDAGSHLLSFNGRRLAFLPGKSLRGASGALPCASDPARSQAPSSRT
jgi:hypothetical protein